MNGYYYVVNAIKDYLKATNFINTVTIGDIFKVDLNKQTIYPLSHFIVNSGTYEGNVWRFNISLLCMDIVDFSKEATTNEFKGNNNEHDVLNTQLAVINRLLEQLRRGDLRDALYQLDGAPSVEPFTDRFEMGVAGWTVTFDVLIANDMTIC